jgi:hypothetical protein
VTRRIEVISLAELRRRAGVDVFPSLPQAVKEQLVALPVPAAGKATSSTRQAANAAKVVPEAADTEEWAFDVRTAFKIIDWLMR